ncbi:DUF732 domain-containing protein [Mycolicibacter arupensis]|uniref:DUF732 domain-containing protein n=1 Tax=Mycolicibacter arupensis TaxID=342002 RepID=UPI003B3B2BD6
MSVRGMFLAWGVAVAIVGAAPAGADPDGGGDGAANDAAFLAAIKASGLTFASEDQAIVAGHAVCSMANNGESGLAVVKRLTADNPGLSMEDASKFAAAAAKAYCPQHLQK